MSAITVTKKDARLADPAYVARRMERLNKLDGRDLVRGKTNKILSSTHADMLAYAICSSFANFAEKNDFNLPNDIEIAVIINESFDLGSRPVWSEYEVDQVYEDMQHVFLYGDCCQVVPLGSLWNSIAHSARQGKIDNDLYDIVYNLAYDSIEYAQECEVEDMLDEIEEIKEELGID